VGKKVGMAIPVLALFLMLVMAGSAMAAQPGYNFTNGNLIVMAESNTTFSGTPIASSFNFSVANAGWYGNIPITFNVTNPSTGNVTVDAQNNLRAYNSSTGSAKIKLNLTTETWFAVNTTNPGCYWVNVSHDESGNYTNFTVCYWKIDSVNLSVGSTVYDLLSASPTIMAGDYPMYVNITAPPGEQYQVSGISLNLTPFELGWVNLTGKCDSNTRACNFSETIQFRNPTTTGYNVTGNITVGDPTPLSVLNASQVNVEPNNPYKFYINATEKTTDGDSIAFALNVTDQYGNLNTTFDGTVNFTAVVLSGNATVNPSSGSFDAPGTYPVYVNATSKPTVVEIRVSGDWNGNSLVYDTETFEFFNPASDLVASVSPAEIYANETAEAKLTAQLVDAQGNPVKVAGKSVTVSQLVDENNPSLGLTFCNTSDTCGATVSDVTDENGTATFTVRAGVKSGVATIQVVGEGGMYDETTLTLKQAPNPTQTVTIPASITAGEGYKIEFTLNDYDNKPIKSSSEFPVEFNITDGDAKWSENNAKVYVASSTDANGNVSATLYSTNVGTSISVTISMKDETGQLVEVDSGTVNVNPGPVADIEVEPGLVVGLPAVKGSSTTISVKLVDEFGNTNTSSAEMIVTTDNPSLGNMTNGTATVNNNLVVSIASGEGSFTYTVNSTEEGLANLTLNVTDFNLVKTVKITTTSPKGVRVYFDRILPLVNEDISVTAQLTTAEGVDLSYPDVELTLVVKLGTNIVFTDTQLTGSDGSVTWQILGTNFTEPGVYTFKASNVAYDISGTNTTTFVGNAVSVEVAVNNTAPQVNDTVEISATFYDANGYVTSQLDGESVTFLINDVNVGSATITNGVASITHTFTEAGDYEIVAYYNATLQDSYLLSVGAPVEVISVSVTPSEQTLAVGESFQFTATAELSDGTTMDVTSLATWEVSNATVGSVTAGNFTALAEGTTYVNATYEGKTGSATVTVTAAVPYAKGDVDGDGSVLPSDALAVLRIYAGVDSPEDYTGADPDVDGDGSILPSDALVILRIYAGVE